jgi:hypothetical protein
MTALNISIPRDWSKNFARLFCARSSAELQTCAARSSAKLQPCAVRSSARISPCTARRNFRKQPKVRSGFLMRNSFSSFNFLQIMIIKERRIADWTAFEDLTHTAPFTTLTPAWVTFAFFAFAVAERLDTARGSDLRKPVTIADTEQADNKK